MKKLSFLAMFAFFFSAAIAYAGFFDDVLKGAGSLSSSQTDDNTIVAGLKEALSIGTDKSIKSLSQVDGYFGNEMVKILMPEKIQKVADVLKKFGFEQQVNDFITSMNRAAEKAAPEAASFFVDAIKEMSFDDARQILKGGDTAATDYFKEKTSQPIYEAFKPIISTTMDEVGVTQSYKNMMGRYESIPLMKKESLDLDHYVTTKAMDGLFYMVGQEEMKIRKDPAARVTELLKQVFGNR